MSIALLALLVSPAAAAVLLLVLPDRSDRGVPEDPARALVWLGLAGATGGAIVALVEAFSGTPISSAGFDADVWRAGLSLGAVLVTASVAARARDRRVAAGMLAALTAGVGSVLAAGTFAFAGLLVATTVAFGVVVFAIGAPVRATLLWYALSDLAAVIGLVLVGSSGMLVPPAARGAGAAALLAAAAIRTGAFPGTRWFDDVVRAAPPLPGLALGVMRAQGFVLAGWVALARSDAATVMGVSGAVLAAWSARRALRRTSASGALSAHAGLALAGLGLGATASLRGALLLVAGSFLASSLLGSGTSAMPSIGAAPLGATLPGAALVAATALARAVVDRSAMATAVPALAALAWLGIAGVAGVQRPGGARTPRALQALLLAATGAVAFAPGLALAGITARAATSIGAARTLAPVVPAIPDELGVVFAVAAVGVLLSGVARGRTPLGRDAAGSAPVELPLRSFLTAMVVEAAAAVGVLVLFGAGLHRGFL